MRNPKIFISFDYEKDKLYKFMLSAWNNNSRFPLNFQDWSSDEIRTNSVSVVKAGLTRRINQADVTLVIIGKDADKQHPDHDEIGYRNWQNFEIARSKQNGNKLIAVKLDNSYGYPEELYGSGAILARSFTLDAICEAVDKL